MKHVDPVALLDELPAPPDPFAEALVRAAAGRSTEIDALLEDASVDWELARMAAVDRAVLRLATAELLERRDVPLAVVIDEAVELAKQYSTEDSGRFVNGVLSTVAARLGV